jgi:phosphoglycerate kinase
MGAKTLDDIKAQQNKTALVRVDFNVPVHDGLITDDTRLTVAIPTIEALRQKGFKVALLAHFDRPKGKVVPEMSLGFLRPALSKLLNHEVLFVPDCIGRDAVDAVKNAPNGAVILLENTRFHPGEEANDKDFAHELSKLGDIYVNDAFSAAHRAHASTEGLAHLLPSYAGHSLARELKALDQSLGNPKRPVMGVVGGSKVSTKLDLLENLITKLEHLVIGGGMANTFLFAQGRSIGGSLCEKDMQDKARQILEAAHVSGCQIHLPLDIVVAKTLEANAPSKVMATGSDLASDDKIFDVGPVTVGKLKSIVDHCHTIIWNGPLGVFEVPPFDQGTKSLAQYVAKATFDKKIISVAGGGDTVSALSAAGVSDDFSFISTAGGAFLEWMEGKTLPGVAALTSD